MQRGKKPKNKGDKKLRRSLAHNNAHKKKAITGPDAVKVRWYSAKDQTK